MRDCGKLVSGAADPGIAAKESGGAVLQPPPPSPLEGVDVYVKFEFSILESSLSPYEKLVWCAIASFNGFARLNPTESQISKRCGVSPRQVRRAIRRLQEVGLIGRLGREFHLLDVAQWAVKAANQTVNVVQQAGLEAHQAPSIDIDTYTQKIKKTPSASRGKSGNDGSMGPSGDRLVDRTPVSHPATVGGGGKHGFESHSPAKKSDPRHDPVKRTIQASYKLENGFEAPWNGRNAKVLKDLLDSLPSWTAEDFIACVSARFLSEVNKASVPKNWITELPEYRNGPLDRFKKPMPRRLDFGEREKPAPGYQGNPQAAARDWLELHATCPGCQQCTEAKHLLAEGK